MADETGIDVPEGFFARGRLGRYLKEQLGNVGMNGRKYPPLDAAPSNPEDGDTYLADGTNWNPAGTGNAAFVQYAGGDWRVIHEHTAAGGL